MAEVHIHKGQGDLTANKSGALLLEAITKVNATLLSYNHHEIDLYNKSAQVRLILKRDPDMDEYIEDLLNDPWVSFEESGITHYRGLDGDLTFNGNKVCLEIDSCRGNEVWLESRYPLRDRKSIC